MTASGQRTARRRWARWSLGPSLVILVAAVALLGRVREVAQAESAYAAALAAPDRADAALAAYDSMRWPSWFDPSSEPLGRGASAFVAGDLAAARAAFEQAFEQSAGDHRCRAAVNLVLTIEAQGDEVIEIDAGAARRSYLDALVRVDADPACRERRDPDGMGAGDRLDRAAARLDAKLSGSPPASSDQRPVSPEQTKDPPDQSDLDDLDRALDENADTRSQGPELEEGGTDIGARPPHVPEW